MANTNWSNGFVVKNASATQGPFELLGGKYGVTAMATFGGGHVDLQILAPDGSTYINCVTSFTANGYASVDLPPCQVQVAVTTATAVYVNCIPISYHR